MGSYWVCVLLFRIFLPCAITAAALVRPTVTSYIYLLMGLWLPFFPVPTFETMTGSTGFYMKILIITCILICLNIVSFFFALFFPKGKEYYLQPCGSIERTLRTVGFVDFRNLPISDALVWCVPEPLMLLTSVGLYMFFKKVTKYEDFDDDDEDETGETALSQEIRKEKILAMVRNLGKYLVLVMFCLTAVIRPSVIGLFYYVVFLFVLTCWCGNKTLGRNYARLLVFLLPIIGGHLTILLIYQMQYFQDSKKVSPRTLFGRLLQLVPLHTYSSCKDPRKFMFYPWNSAHILPYMLYGLFYICVLVAKEILQAKPGIISTIIAVCKRKDDNYVTTAMKMAGTMDREKYEEIAGEEDHLVDQIKRIMDQSIQFIIRISYLLANFVMMIWAICYINWKTLILLIWANVIWLLPARKKLMLAYSPLLVIWVWFLLITSYVYSLDLNIPRTVGHIDLAAGEENKKLHWVHLLIKTMFSVIIFIPMRQFFQKISRGTAAATVKVETKRSKNWWKLLNIIKKWFILAWIWVVVLTMVWMDFAATSNPFRISFVALGMVLVITFQLCPFNCWKKFLKVFWLITIVYAMLNLFLVYLHQMKFARDILHTYVYSEEGFRELGFYATESHKNRLYFLSLPLFFQISVVVQFHYLQKHFNQLTSPQTPAEMLELQKELEEIDSHWKVIITKVTNAKDIFFDFFEIHLTKIMLLFGWLLCCFDCCALLVPFVVLLTASCIFGRTFSLTALYLMSVFVQVLIVTRLVYMNQNNHSAWDYVGYYERNNVTYNVTLNSADWLGFHKSQHGRYYADFWPLVWCFLFVFIVSFQRVVKIRQMNYRLSRKMPTERHRVLFPGVNYQNCHDNTENMLKFLVNYGFYKFGIEITSIMCTILLMIRMDVVAITLSVLLLLTFSLNEKWQGRVWIPLIILVAVWLPFQYLMSLGYWPTNFGKSGTRFWNENDFRVRVQQFCHIMNLAHPPVTKKLIFDFLLLLCLSRQLRTFIVIKAYKGREFGAGSNENVGHLIDSDEIENPVPDFVTYTRNVLDVYKKIFFFSWFYLSLLAVFLAGTMRPAIYSFGYILASFYLMWEGREMFLRPPNSIVKRWNLLIFYNVSIMVFRTASQIVGCILIYEWPNANCLTISLFDVGCIDRFNTTQDIPDMKDKHPCALTHDTVGLEWDCTCFFFLIVQQRIFKSFYFFHVVNNAKAQKILSDRGAKLIEEQRRLRRQDVDNQEAFIRANIKKRIERYRAKRIAIYGAAYARKRTNHNIRLKSADYYLYDEIDRDLDLPILPVHQPTVDADYEPFDPMNVHEYMSLFFKTSIPMVLYERALRKHYKQELIEGRPVNDFSQGANTGPSPGASPIDISRYTATTFVGKIMNVLLFFWGLCESILVTLTVLINRGSKNFRFVVYEMDKYRKILKENSNYTQGIRVGFKQVWKPNRSYTKLFKFIKEGKFKDNKIYYSTIARLLRSIWFLVMSQSEWLCYLVIILNQVSRAKFISLPMPLMVFCWGTLTVPRPTKTFWVIIISYAVIMSLVRNLFAMKLLAWNENAFPENPFFPPSVIGIDRDYSPIGNLLLLSVLIFHRVVLQWQGLWEPRIYHKASLMIDGDYSFVDGQLLPKTGGQASSTITLNVKSTELVRGNYFIHGARKYAEGFRVFIQNLITPSSTQIPVDVYTPMFLCDIINFLLIVFAFGYFKDTDSSEIGVIEYLKYNRVPMTYICIIIGFFAIIVADRWIYRRRNRYAKLVLHLFQVLSIHIWAFVLYPMLTGRIFIDTPVVQVFYVLKCCYFLFSAYQIRNGYPVFISGLCVKHGTSVYNSYGFKLYKMVPYLSQMRAILDWTCTDTTLGVQDWFKMEKISSHFFDRKCAQDAETVSPSDNSDDVKPCSNKPKYFVGSILFSGLFLTLIFPFMLFSLRRSVGVRTHPAKLTFEIYMGTAEPIFYSYAAERSLTRFSKADYLNLTNTFYNIKGSEMLFSTFNAEDVVAVRWSAHSLSSWMISPGSLEEVIEDVKTYKSFGFQIKIRFTHVGSAGEKSEKVFGESTYIPPLPSTVRQALLDMLTKESANKVVWLPLVFPKFLMITNEGKPKVLPMMEKPQEGLYHGTFDKELEAENTMDDDDDDDVRDPERLRNMLLVLKREDGKFWWQIREECNPLDENYLNYLKDLVHNSCNHLVMYTFNEKVFPGTMHYVTGGGIVGLYLLYFMVVFGILRSCFIEISDIWVIDLPNSNRIHRKCKEVYVARDMKSFELEEELYAELIFIMRSRELCIKLTRYDDDPYNPNFTLPGSTARRQPPPPPPPPPAQQQQVLSQRFVPPPEPAIGQAPVPGQTQPGAGRGRGRGAIIKRPPQE